MAFNPITALVGSKHERDIKALLPLLHAVNAKESWALSLSAQGFREATEALKKRHAEGESLTSCFRRPSPWPGKRPAGSWGSAPTTSRSWAP